MESGARSRTSVAADRRLVVWLAGGASLLLVATVLSILSLHEAQRDVEAISRAHEAIARLRSAHLALTDVELAVRDRLLLGREESLAPAARARQAALLHLERVEQLAGGRPAQVERVRAVRRRFEARFHRTDSLARPAGAGSEGLPPATTLAGSTQDLAAIHDAIGEVLAGEEARIAELADATRTAASARVIAYCAIAALILVLLLAAYMVVRREASLRSALQTLKDRLALAVVHDLRNPLSAILGNLDLAALTSPAPPPALATCLGQARRSAQRMMEMVSTIVDVVRLEHGRMPLVWTECDLSAIAADCVAEYQAHAAASGLALALDAPEPVRARADRSVMARVIENLLSNAIKHTPAGGRIDLAVHRRTDAGAVRLVVRDTGEGIAAEDLPRLFTMYGRAERQTRSTRYDTGLGLVFCRLALEAQGGSIQAESRRGEGTSFIVNLPQQRPTA